MAGALLRGLVKHAFTKSAAGGGRSFSLWRTLFTGAAATTAIAKREEIGDALGHAFMNPIDTATDIGEGIGNAYEGVLKFADAAEEKVEGAIDGVQTTYNTATDTLDKANDLVTNPAGALMGGDDNEEGGFNLMTLLKWGGGIGVGGWLLSKIFSGNDNDDKSNDSGMGFGTIFKMALVALGGLLLWNNKDNIMNMVNGDKPGSRTASGTDFMDPDAFEAYDPG